MERAHPHTGQHRAPDRDRAVDLDGLPAADDARRVAADHGGRAGEPGDQLTGGLHGRRLAAADEDHREVRRPSRQWRDRVGARPLRSTGEVDVDRQPVTESRHRPILPEEGRPVAGGDRESRRAPPHRGRSVIR